MEMFSFDPSDPFVVLRLICAVFLVPHILGKFFEPASVEFFKAAKFKPPHAWMYVAGTIETVLAVLLILGIYVPYVAAVAAVHLAVAAGATWKVSGKWLWHIGGMEYPLFWALCCLVLVIAGWPL